MAVKEIVKRAACASQYERFEVQCSINVNRSHNTVG
jgi:hypothetical protein